MRIPTILTGILFSAVAFAATPITVDSVDLNRYMGDWYEIASLPQPFSAGCTCTRAQYATQADGTVSVYNTCSAGSPQGALSEARGVATVADATTKAKLSVKFENSPVAGDYWIIGLDPAYNWAVVSNADGTSLWILSRTPILDEEMYKQALEVATRNQIDLTNLTLTHQNSCLYP